MSALHTIPPVRTPPRTTLAGASASVLSSRGIEDVALKPMRFKSRTPNVLRRA